MGRRIALAFLVTCLGASAWVSEARKHESFSAATYYKLNETAADVIAPKDEPTIDPNGRYPHGRYPGQTHVWNPKTEKYETVNETDTELSSRYPSGHYPGQTHVWNATTEMYESVNETDPANRYPHGHYPRQTHVWNATTEKYETVNGTETDPANRYPRGHYPGQTHVWNVTTEKYESVNEPDTNPANRYPHGRYPRQTHVWNATTEKYETVNDTETDPAYRYPHGHYPGQTHVWNATTEKYETVNDTETDPANRYPHGHYPGQIHVWNPKTERYETVNRTDPDPIVTNPSEGRYEHGYYGKAIYNYSESDTLEVVKCTNCSYTEEPKSNETTTLEGTQNRYPAGYYNGHSTYPTAYKQSSTVSQTKVDPKVYDPDLGRYPYGYSGNNFPKTAQNSTTQTGMPGDRYPHGYHSTSEYAQQSHTTSFSQSNMGNFKTLPYPSTGMSYVPNGAGCRTAYWAENPSSWPAFLKITSTVGDVFGSKAIEVYGQTTVLEALLKYRSDPFSELLRSACTSLLNSYTRGEFPLSPMKVIEKFIAALVSKDSATKEALEFETVNVESISAGSACT